MVYLHEAVVVYGRGVESEFKLLDESFSPQIRALGFSVVGEPKPTLPADDFERITPAYQNLEQKYSFETNPKRSEVDRLSMRFSYFKRKHPERRYILDLWVESENTQRLFPRLAVFSDLLESTLRQTKPKLWALLTTHDRITNAGLTLGEIRQEMRQQVLPAAKGYMVGILPSEIGTAAQIQASASQESYLASLASEAKSLIEALPAILSATPRK